LVTTSRWIKLKGKLRRRGYWVGVIGVALTAGIAITVVFCWEEVGGFGHYGYIGAFFIGVLGGATILAPIPMTPLVFALGTVIRPSFAPYLGPVFVGLGETIGGLFIYMTGYGGGTTLFNSTHNRIQAVYSRLLRWVERRGSLTLFTLSAVINPFFYPAALAAGALRFDIRRYFLVCWIGKTIKGISVATAGYWGLGELLRVLGVSV